MRARTLLLLGYLVCASLPLYWMINLSLKGNAEIASTITFWPEQLTLENYRFLLTNRIWYASYLDSLIYVLINTVASLLVALPAAYAFSRYAFLADRFVLFWLLANWLTPTAIFVLPYFQYGSALGLLDTHPGIALAHLVFTVPLAVWILAHFMARVPRELDECAYIDGYTFAGFFVTVYLPLIKVGIAVTAFLCFLFSWVELLLARSLSAVEVTPIAVTIMGAASAPRVDWGVLAAAGVVMTVPGVIGLILIGRYLTRGFGVGRR